MCQRLQPPPQPRAVRRRAQAGRQHPVLAQEPQVGSTAQPPPPAASRERAGGQQLQLRPLAQGLQRGSVRHLWRAAGRWGQARLGWTGRPLSRWRPSRTQTWALWRQQWQLQLRCRWTGSRRTSRLLPQRRQQRQGQRGRTRLQGRPQVHPAACPPRMPPSSCPRQFQEAGVHRKASSTGCWA